MAVFMPIDTKSSWSAAAGMDWIDAGADRIRRVLAEHEAGEHARALRQERRQVNAEGRVRHPVQTPFGEDAHHRDRRADHVHRQRHGASLEVGARQREPGLGQEDRVVAHAVQLDLDLPARPLHRVDRRPDDLGRGAHGVRVLNLGLHLPGGEVAALDAAHDRPRSLDGSREPPELVETRVVGLEVGDQRLERHGAGDLCLLEPPRDVVELDGAHRREEVRAVDGRQAVARLQPRNWDPGAVHRLPSRQPLTAVERLALAHEQERGLCHGG
jgi:hypothetical protein